MSIRRIAHVTDLHLLSFRSDGVSPRVDARTRFVSLGRALDPEARAARAESALQHARALGAEHFVLSGDLTELGLAAEFELLAAVLSDAGIGGDEVTLVPGNHDRYSEPEGFAAALDGPLSPWARHASSRSTVVDLGSIRLLPVDVTRPQSVMRSGGQIGADQLRTLSSVLDDPSIRARPAALVQHHPPFALPPVVHFVDGLQGHDRLGCVLASRDAVQVVFGHLHRHIDRGGSAAIPRLLGAPCVVDDASAFRLYDVTADGLSPVNPSHELAVRAA